MHACHKVNKQKHSKHDIIAIVDCKILSLISAVNDVYLVQ